MIGFIRQSEMKSLLVILQFFVLYQTLLAGTYQDCIKSLKVKTDSKGDPDPRDPNYKCITKCELLNKNLLTIDGNFNIQEFSRKFQPFVTPCANNTKSKNDCERKQEFVACVYSRHDAIFNSCKLETKTTLKLAKEVLPKNMPVTGACYQRCIYKKYGIINAKDEVNVEGLKVFVKEGMKLEGIVKNCRQATNGSGCVGVLDTLQCVAKTVDQKFTTTANSCLTELGVKVDENGLPSLNDPKLHCLKHCIYIKQNLEDTKGNIIRKNLSPFYYPVIKACEQKQEKDLCVRANNFGKCAWNESIKIRKECASKTNPKHFSYDTFPKELDDKKACYYSCLFKKYQLVTAADEIDLKGVKMYLKDDQRVEDAVKNCTEKNRQPNKCVRMLHTAYCLQIFFKYSFD